jgi:hypothetical protein
MRSTGYEAGTTFAPMSDSAEWSSLRELITSLRNNWPAWYAAYMVAEQAGTDLPT